MNVNLWNHFIPTTRFPFGVSTGDVISGMLRSVLAAPNSGLITMYSRIQTCAYKRAVSHSPIGVVLMDAFSCSPTLFVSDAFILGDPTLYF